MKPLDSNHVEALHAAVVDLQTSEGWQRWLQARRNFKRYSFRNQLLIATQRPDATRVMGFRPWLKYGRCVTKGETALRVLGPMEVKKRVNGKIVVGPDGKPAKRRIFVLLPVFDIAQTHEIEVPNPLPLEPPTPDIAVEGDELAAKTRYDELVAWLREIPVNYELHDDRGQAYGGYFEAQMNTVAVVNRGNVLERLRVLVHESVHALGVTAASEGDRAVSETITDAAAHVVLQELGIVAHDSVPYLAGWAKDPATLLSNATRISILAGQVAEAFAPPEDTPLEQAA
jgi:hypothetical protein